MKKDCRIFRLMRILAIAVTALAVWSCDHRENVVGQWQFSPDAGIMCDTTAVSGVTSCLVISGDGRVLLTTDIELTQPTRGESGNYADSVALRAVASIEGTWRYAKHRNNEIDIKYDYSTFGVSIDPEDVSYRPVARSGRMSVIHDVMKAATIEEYTQKLGPGIEAYFKDFVKMEKIRVDDGVMYCEGVDHAYVMRAL